MKTQLIQFSSLGGPEVLQLTEIELAAPGADEVLIEHKAIGVNFIETYYRSGLYPVNLPSSLGTEATGVVLEVGSHVKNVKPGDRVAYMQGPLGAYSQKRILHAKFLLKLPESIPFETAAAMMLKGLTVQYLFRQTYGLQKEQTILFHAAAGGVGLIACQWAKHLGVKLIGTVSTDEKAALAKQNGAWETINYSHEDVAKRVLELTDGKKVPVVYDGVGKSTWEASLDSLETRGLLVSFGNASGAVTNVSLGILAQKGSLYVTRPTTGSYFDTPEKLQKGGDELMDLVGQGILKIQTPTQFPLKEAGRAHEHISSRSSTGSTILIP
jgi:NADPH2:quinone reductase